MNTVFCSVVGCQNLSKYLRTYRDMSFNLCEEHNKLNLDIGETVTKEEWHAKYKETLIYKGLPEDFAEEACQAGMDSFDYNEDPVDSALEELGYWNSDY